MKSDLAERLLQALMDWDVPRFSVEVRRIQMLASIKYDEYGQYRPGVKFAENLARWLEQFESDDERAIAYDFVAHRLVFISDVEMTHLIEVAYPDVLEQRLLDRVARDNASPRRQVRRLRSSVEFEALQRRCLFLGLSDGARLDRLRRASGLSHEQFHQDYTIAYDQAKRMQDELASAMASKDLPGDRTFCHVFLVDDFSGSGRTLIRRDEDDKFKGKLLRFRQRLEDLREAGIFDAAVEVTILLYVASEQARDHVEIHLNAAGLSSWDLRIVQTVPRDLRVDRTDPSMEELCRLYFDPSSIDRFKKETPIGYSDCALPLVLSHNTPNNSVCLLWAETSAETGLGRIALFPRYERHHKDRP